MGAVVSGQTRHAQALARDAPAHHAPVAARSVPVGLVAGLVAADAQAGTVAVAAKAAHTVVATAADR